MTIWVKKPQILIPHSIVEWHTFCTTEDELACVPIVAGLRQRIRASIQ